MTTSWSIRVAHFERIIQDSLTESDAGLDPFAACGTTIAAAQKLNRQWIGIDVTQLSIALLKNRLEGNFGLLPDKGGNPRGSKGVSSAALSLKGTNIIAQGKAQGRHSGNASSKHSDPEGVEQTMEDVAPRQGADIAGNESPGFLASKPASVAGSPQAHPGLLSSSPSATLGYDKSSVANTGETGR